MTSRDFDKNLLIMRDIIVAYLSKNRVRPEKLDIFIGDVYRAVITSQQPRASGQNNIRSSNEYRKPTSEDINKSLGDDGIVSFIDGRIYKTLRRHLTAHGLTPDTYREIFGLDKNYPMVARSYAERRSSIARRTGLGRTGFMAALKAKDQN